MTLCLPCVAGQPHFILIQGLQVVQVISAAASRLAEVAAGQRVQSGWLCTQYHAKLRRNGPGKRQGRAMSAAALAAVDKTRMTDLLATMRATCHTSSVSKQER